MAGGGSGMFSFAMLRLATNGTTAAETELIATAIGHDKPHARPFATIDELIDLQMAHGTESGPTLAPSFDTGAHALPERGSIAALGPFLRHRRARPTRTRQHRRARTRGRIGIRQSKSAK